MIHQTAMKTGALALALVALSTALAVGAGQAGKNVSNSLTRVGTGSIHSAKAGEGLDIPGEFRDDPEVDAQFNRGGKSLARVPADGVPRPADNGLAALDGGFLGFPGVNHRQQRLADNGHQFSLEPPDPAMAVGPSQVVSAVNTALGVYDKAGHLQGNIASLNQFFGLPSEVVVDAEGVATYGPFVSDPKVLFDASTGRWFVSILEVDQDPQTGAWLNTTHVYIAVSQTSDATGGFDIYRLDTSDIGLPDQPLIGVDANGLFVSVNSFLFPDLAFNGGIIYAISKSGLIGGGGGTVSAVRFDSLVQAEGPGYSIQPANIPPNGDFDLTHGGTEYFLSALDFNATLDNRVTAWAITGTASLGSASPNLSIQNVVLNTLVYGQPPAAQQKPGPTPLGDILRSGALGQRFPEKLPLINANDDRMNSVCYAAGCLWGGVNTVIKAPNGPTRVGVAYFAVQPSWNGGTLTAQVAKAGYVAVNQQNLLFPAIAVNSAGHGIIAFTLVGPDYFPSAAYAPLSLDNGAGAVRIAGPGVEPADGFSGYRAFSGGNVERWGDYHTAVVDADGSFWFTAQCNLGGPRTFYANWSTFIGRVAPY
jgi:hypothetical protein